ncbi:MAG: hypothetical protein ACE5HO_03295 [bacterium]
MRKQIKQAAVWSFFVVLSSFFLGGCYTQLAKPDRHDDDEYYVEEYQESEPEDDSEEAYEEAYEGEDEEEYQDVDIQRNYYGNVYVIGPYGGPWFYDPFFYDPFYYDPFFYDPFYYDPFFYGFAYSPHYYPPPHHSGFSVFIGFYDPAFWCGTYWYARHGAVRGFHAAGRFNYPYFAGGAFAGGSFGGASGLPVKKRDFGRGGTTVVDNFGRTPRRRESGKSQKTTKTGVAIDNVTKIGGSPTPVTSISRQGNPSGARGRNSGSRVERGRKKRPSSQNGSGYRRKHNPVKIERVVKVNGPMQNVGKSGLKKSSRGSSRGAPSKVRRSGTRQVFKQIPPYVVKSSRSRSSTSKSKSPSKFKRVISKLGTLVKNSSRGGKRFSGGSSRGHSSGQSSNKPSRRRKN